jgi:hypothetical protein
MSEYGIILKTDIVLGIILVSTAFSNYTTIDRFLVPKVSSTPAAKGCGERPKDKHFAARDGATSRATSQESSPRRRQTAS